MLRLTDDSGRSHGFLVADVHHHVGSEGQTRNLNPKEPNGSYDFFRGVQYGSESKPGLATILRDSDAFKYHITGGEAFPPHPMLRCLSLADERMGRAFEGSWAIDLSVAFPMHDDFRSNDVVEYRASNRRLAKVVGVLPNSLRFIPWGRVNPDDGAVACEELHRAASEDGIRGLKLHPKSEGFDLEGAGFRLVLRAAARHALPVILHTDWKSDRRRIVEAVDDTIVALASEGDVGAIADLRVILGHFGWAVDPEMIGFIAHPCVYGEVSGLRGRGATEFFRIARDHFPDHRWDASALLSRVPDPSSVSRALRPGIVGDWSRKVMYGSDNPFLNQNNSIDTIGAILGRELDLTALEVANILGLNALALFANGADGMDGGGRPAPPAMTVPGQVPFSGTLEDGALFLAVMLKGLPQNMRRVRFVPLLAAEPQPRLLPELGVLHVSGREESGTSLLSVQLGATGRMGFMAIDCPAFPPAALGDPLSQLVADGLVAAASRQPGCQAATMAEALVLSRLGTRGGEEAQED